MKLARLLSIIAPAIFAVASAGAQTPVFSDTFENGAPLNSEAIPGFWALFAPPNTSVRSPAACSSPRGAGCPRPFMPSIGIPVAISV
jgi:hypothetical protein